VAANEWLDWAPLRETALAAFLTCLCDQGGPIRRRLPAVLAFTALGASCAMPVAGRISHRFGSRTALRGLLALWTLSLVLPSLAPNLPALCLAMFTYGACAGMSDVAMNALGVEIERRLGKSIMSGLHGMWSAGALTGSAAGTLAAATALRPWLRLMTLAVKW
jgi:MFS family permease